MKIWKKNLIHNKKIMNKIRLMLRWLFIPLWIALFFLCIYLYGIYKELVLFQLSRLLGCFSNIMG